jgi:hypothetical protein
MVFKVETTFDSVDTIRKATSRNAELAAVANLRKGKDYLLYRCLLLVRMLPADNQDSYD